MWVLIKKVLMTLRNVQIYYNVCILAYVCRKIGMYVGKWVGSGWLVGTNKIQAG